jgi:ribosome-binding protein aMBF1 (putative translation factor)
MADTTTTTAAPSEEARAPSRRPSVRAPSRRSSAAVPTTTTTTSKELENIIVEAFEAKDAQASRLAHEVKKEVLSAPENHGGQGR